MPCVAVPKLSLPTLPGPLTLTPPAAPSVSFNPQWCCKLPSYATPPIPPIPGVILNPAVVMVLRSAIGAITGYLDAIPLKCPREA